jgi:hypothetical protein
VWPPTSMAPCYHAQTPSRALAAPALHCHLVRLRQSGDAAIRQSHPLLHPSRGTECSMELRDGATSTSARRGYQIVRFRRLGCAHMIGQWTAHANARGGLRHRLFRASSRGRELSKPGEWHMTTTGSVPRTRRKIVGATLPEYGAVCCKSHTGKSVISRTVGMSSGLQGRWTRRQPTGKRPRPHCLSL